MFRYESNLKSLVSSSGHEETRDWSQIINSLGSVLNELSINDFEPRSIPPSLLEQYLGSVPSLESSVVDGLVSRYLSHPDRMDLARPLSSILLSDRSDEAVSGEMLEMIGYDEIDLAMSIISQRRPFGQKLREIELDTKPSSQATTKLKRGKKGRAEDEPGEKVYLTPEQAKRNMEASLRVGTNHPLFTHTAGPEVPVYPNVFASSSNNGTILSSFGTKFTLPIGTTREDAEEWEEVTIPPANTVPPRMTERLIRIADLDPLARGSFPGYTTLNRIQSIVFSAAYNTKENLLICAPTGAGKTDIAMLTILRVLNEYSINGPRAAGSSAESIHRDDFKIIYVAPMKALASEIVRKLGKRLQWLSIRVKELTGDMQMTRAEIAETQIIVTTPEKWDVVTRKPTGEGELASKVKLLIIDEVHLLNEDRGATIETIVARTLRQVESTQSFIRVVGLSATLPNYVDVAKFLRVSPYTGLFFFDSSFRPIPLEQRFLGIKGKANSPQSRRSMDKAAFTKVSELIEQGHQVMVFVHARKETVKAALALKEAATVEGISDDFSSKDHPLFELYRREIGASRNKEMKMLFDHGFGIHHAGMLRSDRNLMERMFEARVIKVLCCTATLAWGVNLPAHAVIIKGTQIYDSAKGSFVDLSVLDVLQIFGRAGRPGFETSGVGYICTTHDKLDHYLNAVTAQHPIESKFVGGMTDALNAEISLGTVSSITDAVQWVGYTYLFVRMRRNPTVYGISYDELREDPDLLSRRHHLITTAAKKLSGANMVQFNESSGTFLIKDHGRIAAKYYISHSTIGIFNKELRPIMTEADVLALLSMSTEFDQIQLRESELEELRRLLDEIPCEVKDGTDTSKGKVNILLQAHVSDLHVEDFALVSDTAYVAQNGGRIIRSLLELALSKKWANVSAVLAALCKAVEKQIWSFENPMKQFKLHADLLHNLRSRANDFTPAELATKTSAELGRLLHMNDRHGAALLKAAKQFPSAEITYALRPLSPCLLKISVRITPTFEWNNKLHGVSEPFWIWVEDHSGANILQHSHLQFRQGGGPLEVDFILGINDQPPPSVTLRILSDTWLGAEEEVPISLEDLIMPQTALSHLERLEIPFLPFSALNDADLERTYGSTMRRFNSIQTRCFWSLYRMSRNVSICGPVSGGKSLCGHLAVWRNLSKCPTKHSIVVMPSAHEARVLATTLRELSHELRVDVLTSKAGGRLMARPKAVVIITPGVLLACLDDPKNRDFFQNLSLVVCENLELLNDEYEIAVSLLLHVTQSVPVRFVAISASLNDPLDLSRWLRIKAEDIFNFSPNDRDQLLPPPEYHPSPLRHSPALFKSMIRPVHSILRSNREKSTIVFVPSRSQCRVIANDLLTRSAAEMDTRGFLGSETDIQDLEFRLTNIRDRSLMDVLLHGIGVYHQGQHSTDRLAILELFTEGAISVLIVPHDLCWTLPVHANVVIAMGTQYLQIEDTEISRGHRRFINYPIQELVRMQGLAVRSGQSGAFHLFCQAEERDTFIRYFEDGLPLESTLHGLNGTPSKALMSWLAGRRASGSIRGKQDMMDFLSSTFLARRIRSNPVYYDTRPALVEERLSSMVGELFEQTEVTQASTTLPAMAS